MATTAKAKTRRKAASKAPSRKLEDKAQYERFREFARKVEVDEDSESFDSEFRKIVPPRAR